MERLTDEQIKTIDQGYCPDCGHRGFVMGPRGGMSVNIECGDCGNRFNVAGFSLNHHIVTGERIPSRKEGGSDWGSDPDEKTEYVLITELRWAADMRAIKRWQEATGKTLTWPDHADLVVWLLEQLDAAEAKVSARQPGGQSGSSA